MGWLVSPFTTGLATGFLMVAFAGVFAMIVVEMKLEHLKALVPEIPCAAPLVTSSQPPVKARKRRNHRSRRSKLSSMVQFFMAEGESEVDEASDDLFDLDDELWHAPAAHGTEIFTLSD